jgi:Spy/CpxP family protein refolding chaperone
MKRKFFLISASLVLIFVAMFAFQQWTQAQAPTQGSGSRGGGQSGPPTGMMMMQILPLEMEWTQISFALNVSDDVLIKARKAFQDTWTKRKAIMDKADPNGDDENARRAMRDGLTKLKTELNTKLKAILAPKQMEVLAKWEKENQNRARQRQAGGSGGEQPGGARP